MPKPTHLARPRPLVGLESTTGTVDGDGNVEWPDGPVGTSPSTLDSWKQPVRVATTANITISTALNAGDTIDGVTLAAGDRVLVKDQSTGSQNGVYVAGITPARAVDFDDDDEVMGSLVYVIAGTTNGGKAFKNTNASAPTVGTTSLTFAEFGAGGSASFATPAIVLGSSAAAGAASTVIRSDATIAAFDATSPTTQAIGDSAAVGTAAFAARRDHKHGMPSAAAPSGGYGSAAAGSAGSVLRSDAVLPKPTEADLNLSDVTTANVSTTKHGFAPKLPNDATKYLDGTGAYSVPSGGSSGVTVQDEGSSLSTTATTLNFVGSGVTASGTGATKTITIPGASGFTLPSVTQMKFAGTAVSSITLDAAPASGQTVLLLVDAFNTADPTAISSTNTTWTKIKSVSAGAKYSVWVGVVSGGSGGTTITITHSNSFLSCFALVVTDTLTGTLGTSGNGTAGSMVNTAAAVTSGRLVFIAGGCDDTTKTDIATASIPTSGLLIGTCFGAVGYAVGQKVSAFLTSSGNGGAGSILVCEIT